MAHHLAVRAVLAGLIDLVISPFSSRPRPKKLLRIFVQGLVRYRLEHDSIASEKRRYPSTEEAYLAYTAKKGIQSSTDVVGDAKAHWLGSKESAKILVWFHGKSNPVKPSSTIQYRDLTRTKAEVLSCRATKVIMSGSLKS